MAETRYTDTTIPRLTKWCRRNMRRHDIGQHPQPFLVLGSPGIGKSDFCEEIFPSLIAEHWGIQPEEVGYYEFNCNGKDEVEATGPALPYKNPQTGEVEFKYGKSPIVTAAEKVMKEGGFKYMVVNLDEFAQGTQGLMKTLRGSLNPKTHKVGETCWPRNVYIMGTGNLASDKAGSSGLLKHIPSVCKVVNLKFSMPALKKYWVEHKLNPLAIEVAEAFHEEGFFVNGVPAYDGAYCCPRSLVNSSYDLDVIMSEPDFDGTLTADDRDYLSTTIGEQAASTLMMWVNRHDHLPSSSEILSQPRSALVPDQMGYQSIAAHIALNACDSEAAANAAIIYITRLRPDLQVPLLTKLIRECNSMGWSFTTDEAINFLEKYSDLLPLTWNN